jgi:hypothetical protein
MSKLRGFLIGLGIATLGAVVIRTFSGLSFLACLAIAVGAMLVNGWVAEWEDNRPGGFNNPTPDDPSTRTQRDPGSAADD